MTEPRNGQQVGPPGELPVGRRAAITLTVSGVVLCTAFAAIAAAVGQPRQPNADPTQYGSPAPVTGVSAPGSPLTDSATASTRRTNPTVPPPTTITSTLPNGEITTTVITPAPRCVAGPRLVRLNGAVTSASTTDSSPQATTPTTTGPTTTTEPPTGTTTTTTTGTTTTTTGTTTTTTTDPPTDTPTPPRDTTTPPTAGGGGTGGSPSGGSWGGTGPGGNADPRDPAPSC